MSSEMKSLVGVTAPIASFWTVVCLLLAVFTTTLLVACDEQREDVSYLEPYRSMVGAKFRVGDDVAAYGIYRYPQRDAVVYATIIPGVGIAGPEVAYKKQIPKGTILSIQKVVRIGELMGSRIDYIVVVENDVVPNSVELRLEMRGGNEGSGLLLNSRIYERTN